MVDNRIFNSGIGARGHSGEKPTENYGYVPADDGFANSRFWQIDLHHIATGKCVQFKSFITKFSDNWQSQYSSNSVYGRMDPIQIFQGTKRTIELGWSVPSVDAIDGQKNLHKFEHLASMLYPTYEVHKNNLGQTIRTMSSSPLMRIKFANLVQDVSTNSTSPAAIDGGLVGTVSGFSMNPNLDMGFFNPSPGILYPKEYELSCTFSVLHTHALGWNEDTIDWLGDPDGATNYAYGIHPMTGDHSICKEGYKTQPANKSSSEVGLMNFTSEDVERDERENPDVAQAKSTTENSQERIATSKILGEAMNFTPKQAAGSGYE